jgi:hypothetical protein
MYICDGNMACSFQKESKKIAVRRLRLAAGQLDPNTCRHQLGSDIPIEGCSAEYRATRAATAGSETTYVLLHRAAWARPVLRQSSVFNAVSTSVPAAGAWFVDGHGRGITNLQLQQPALRPAV